MKILLTVHQFVPDYTSGTEILTFSVAKELLRRGHEVFVYTGFPAQQDMPDNTRLDRYEIEGIRVYRYYHSIKPLADQQVITEIEYNNHLAAQFFETIVQEVQPDIIHFFHLSRLGIGLVDVAIAKGILAYLTPTDFWSVCPTGRLLLDDGSLCDGPSAAGGNCVKHVVMITRGDRVKKYAPLMNVIPTPVVDIMVSMSKSFLGKIHPFGLEVAAMSNRLSFNITKLNKLNAIFSPTRLMTKTLIHNGVNANLIRQSAFGIDISNYEPHNRQRNDMARTIGFIGTLSPHKGCHILIQAFKQLNLPDLRLKIYGNSNEFPDYYAELKTLSSNNENIEFCGTFPNTQIASVLNALDVLVVPSLWYENTPLVVFSAFAAHCPVIASDFPGMSEVVLHEQNGLVFPAGNSDALAEQLCLLATTPDLLARLSLNCKAPKSSEEYVNELETIYQVDLAGKF